MLMTCSHHYSYLNENLPHQNLIMTDVQQSKFLKAGSVGTLKSTIRIHEAILQAANIPPGYNTTKHIKVVNLRKENSVA